jgi:hypothetical protein
MDKIIRAKRLDAELGVFKFRFINCYYSFHSPHYAYDKAKKGKRSGKLYRNIARIVHVQRS